MDTPVYINVGDVVTVLTTIQRAIDFAESAKRYELASQLIQAKYALRKPLVALDVPVTRGRD
jgi:hypothetical protein